MAAPRYTLVVPTYNRPDDLGRLLRFLAWQKADFPVLVLDSSRPAEHERNAAAARGLALDLRLERFDPAMPPWEKFRRGAEMVATDFSSLCADDDLVLVPSLGPILDFLARNPKHHVAHGWYFEFFLSGALGLTQIVYRSPSIEDEQPAERLNRLFANYEALTYGVHRTALLREVMTRVQGVDTLLFRELLGGALAVVAGKVARLPILYAGRSRGDANAHADSTPFHFLVGSPQDLDREYRRYRDILARQVPLESIDQAYQRYLSRFFTPKVRDFVREKQQLGWSREEILHGIWPVYLEKTGLEGALHRSRFLKRMRDRFVPWLRGYHVRKVTRAGRYRVVIHAGRDYHVHRDFEAALGEGGFAKPEELIGVLGGYG